MLPSMMRPGVAVPSMVTPAEMRGVCAAEPVRVSLGSAPVKAAGSKAMVLLPPWFAWVIAQLRLPWTVGSPVSVVCVTQIAALSAQAA
ncbi:hypothetical protein PPNSA23_09970 [Phyllobacterium phragmitis]|uniref:Uncharacterized protein n=1 Tax=Phyllobacterium phragmitis TaxID=2670329 RepID=A0ABQ0GWK3_9HYPH